MPQEIGGFPVPSSIVACLGENRAADLFGYEDFVDHKIDLGRIRTNLLENFRKILDLKLTYPIFKKYFIKEKGRTLQDGEVIRLLCSQGQNNLAEDISWLNRVFTPKVSQAPVISPNYPKPEKPKNSPEKVPQKSPLIKVDRQVELGGETTDLGDSLAHPTTSGSQSEAPQTSRLSLILSESRNNQDHKVKLIRPHQKSEKDKTAMNSPKSKAVSTKGKMDSGTTSSPAKEAKPLKSDDSSSDEDIIPSTQMPSAKSSAIHKSPSTQKRFVKAKPGALDLKADDSSESSDGSVKSEKPLTSPHAGQKPASNKDLSGKDKRTSDASGSDESKSSDVSGDEVRNSPNKIQNKFSDERSSPVKKMTPTKSNAVKNDEKPPQSSRHSISDNSDSEESDDRPGALDQDAQDVTAMPSSPKSSVKNVRPSCVLGELELENYQPGSSGAEKGQLVGSRKRKASDSSIELPRSKEPKISHPASDDAEKMSGTSDSESDSDESESAVKRPEKKNSSPIKSNTEPKGTPKIDEVSPSPKKVHPFDSTRLPGDLDASFPGNDISVIRQCSTPPVAVAKELRNGPKKNQPLTPTNQRSILEFAKPTPPAREPADDEYAAMKQHYIRLGFTDLNEDFDFESKTAIFAEDLLDDDSEVYLLQCPDEVDGDRFLGQRLEINTHDPKLTTLKDGKSYEMYYDAYNPNRFSNMIFPSRKMKRFSFNVVPILGKITVSEAVPVPKVPEFDVTPSTPVPFPTNLKARNSLASSNSSVISDTSSQSSFRMTSKKPKAIEEIRIKTPEKKVLKEEHSLTILSDQDKELSEKKKKKRDKDKKPEPCEAATIATLPILTQPFLERDADVHKKKKKKKDKSFDDSGSQGESNVKEEQLVDKVALIIDADQSSSKKKNKKKHQQIEAEASVDQDTIAAQRELEENCKKKKKKKHLEKEEGLLVIRETTSVETEQEEGVKKKKKKKKHLEEEREDPVAIEEPPVPEPITSDGDPTVHKKKKKKKNKKLEMEVTGDSEIGAVDTEKRPSAEIEDDKEQLLIDRVAYNVEPDVEVVPKKKKKKKKHLEEMSEGIHGANSCERPSDDVIDDKQQLLIDRALRNLEPDLEDVPKKKKKKRQKEMADGIHGANSCERPSDDVLDDKQQLLIDRALRNLEPDLEEVPKKKKKKRQKEMADEIDGADSCERPVEDTLDDKKQLLIGQVLKNLEPDLEEVPKKKKKKKKHSEEIADDLDVPLKNKKSKKVKIES